MTLSARYVAVRRLVEKKPDAEFSAVEPVDSFVYKGVVARLPDEPVFLSSRQLMVGDVVVFAKNSPDTFEVDDRQFHEEKVKLVRRDDLLAVI